LQHAFNAYLIKNYFFSLPLVAGCFFFTFIALSIDFRYNITITNTFGGNFMKKNYILSLTIIICIILAVIVLVNGRNNKKDNENLKGYTQVREVDGTSFYINSEFIDRATAVVEISDSVNFEKNQFYSYSNGSDKYLLFNMSSLVVAAQKGTSFHINTAEDKQQALKNSDLLNIWFDKGTDDFDCKTENDVTVTKVAASVSINKTTYGDYCGELINIEKSGEEWSLFVGVPGQKYDDISKAASQGIDTIINSFSLTDETAGSDQIYAVSISGNSDKNAVEIKEGNTGSDADSLNLNNQKEIVNKNGEMAYTSSPYNMLSIGDNGLLSIFNDQTTRYEDAIICPKEVYRGTDAEAIIKDFCETTKQYEYNPCENEYMWEVIQYDLNYVYCDNAQDGYVNITLCGVDGKSLVYKDNIISGRTYDMTYKAEKDGDWIRNLYCYYQIPIGCTQYCIMAGENKSVNDQDVTAAYYWLTETDTEEPKEEIKEISQEQSDQKDPETESAEKEEPTNEAEPKEEIEPTEEAKPSKVPEKKSPKPSKKSPSSKTAASKTTPQPVPQQPVPQQPITPQPQPKQDNTFVEDGYSTID
jgi:hypothetical protein